MQILFMFKLVMLICHADRQKAAWFAWTFFHWNFANVADWPHLKHRKVSDLKLYTISCWLHSLASVTFGWLLSRFSSPYETGAPCERLPSSIQPQSATLQPSKEQKPDHAMLFFFLTSIQAGCAIALVKCCDLLHWVWYVTAPSSCLQTSPIPS